MARSLYKKFIKKSISSSNSVIDFAYFEEVEYHYILYQLLFVREGVETKVGIRTFVQQRV